MQIRITIRLRGLITCLAVLTSCQLLPAGGNAASFNARPLEPWKDSCVADMYYFVPTRAGTSLPYLVFTNSCRSSHGCEAVLQYGGDSEAHFIPFDWSIYYDTGGGGGYVVGKQINLPTANPQYLTSRPDQFGVVRQMLRVRNGTYYLGPADGLYKFRNQIDLFDFVRGDWDVFHTREFYAQTEAEAASWRGEASSLAWMPMVETFGNYANLMTEVLGCDLARFFYDGECMWQTPDNTSANLSPVGQSHPLDDGNWLTLSHAPHTHFAVCLTTSSHQPTVAPPMGTLCVTANSPAAGFTLNTASGSVDPHWASTPDGQWWDRTVGQLPPGYYRITFTPVPGESTPAEQIFQVIANDVTTVTAVYGDDADKVPVAVLIDPSDQQTVWGDAIPAEALVAAGTPPYTVTFFTSAGGGAYTPAGVATAEPYTVSLGTLPIGTYQIYATVTDSSTPTPKTANSATTTFIVSPLATWTNPAATGNWSNPLSWDGGAVPVSGATAIFGTGGNTAVVDTVSREVSSIFFTREGGFALAASGGAGLTVNNGITVSSNFTHTISAPVTLGGANTWTVNGTGTLQAGGAVGGNATLTKGGSGTLALTVTNNFSGGLTHKAGTLLLGSGNALGTGPLTINGGSINGTSGSLTMPNNNPVVLNGTFTWTGAGGYSWNMGTSPVTLNTSPLVHVGNTLTIGGPVSGPGGLNALDIAFKNMVGATYGVQLLAPITLRADQTITGSGATISGAIGDDGHGYGLNLAVSDVWGGWGGTVGLNAANTYRGDTTVSTGSLAIGHNRALQHSALHAAASSARLSVTSPTIGGLKGSTDLAAVFTAGYNSVAALTLNPQDGSCIYSGAIADGAAGMTLTKSGNGTQVLGGPLTHTGATNVDAGTLVLDGAGTGGGAVTVKPGACLGGGGSTTSAVTVQAGGKLLASITDWEAGTSADLTVSTLALPATWSLDVNAAGLIETDKVFRFLTATGGISGFTAPTVNGPGAGAWQVRQNPSDAGVLELAYTASSGAPTTLELVSSLNPAAEWQSVTFTATVMIGGGTATGATGTCVFSVDDTIVATVPVTDGTASYTTGTLTSGVHAIMATYSGDAGHATSSAGLTQVCANPIVPTYTTRGDGKTVATFTSGSGVWTIPAGVDSVEVLVLGGGGAGARGGAFGLNPNPGGGSPGGGAGGLYFNTIWAVTGGSSVTIEVGAGGPGTTVTGDGAAGFQSVFGNIIAYGGQGGQYLANQGGNQGGHSTDNGANLTPGFLGGTGSGATGGGGAGEDGRDGAFSPAYGGAGVTNSITGSPIGYGGGGSAGYDGVGLGHGALFGGGEGSEPEGTPGTSGVNGKGGGGGGGRTANAGGGGSGIVIVAYQAAAEPYDTWAGPTGYNLSGGSDADDDGDGLSNFEEFAFGLDPTSGASSSPITMSPDRVTHTFRYTRWAASGLNYTIETSTTLQGWDGPAAATQVVVATHDGVETVEVTLASPPSGGILFVRVKAQ
jgi:autotransporter-associated beta strand protein